MSQPVTVTLEEPLQRGESKIEQVTLRRPKGGALRGLNLQAILQMDVMSLRTLLPRITEPTLTANDVDNLDPADLTALGAEVASFLLPKEAAAQLSPKE
jgi:hypothetical protein